MTRSEKILFFIVFFSFILATFSYRYMPEKMVTNWSLQGEPSGYISRFWGVAIMPLVGLILFLIFLVIPKIDPLKTNLEKFRTYFDKLIASIFLFLLYLYILTLIWNTGREFNMVRVIVPAFFLLWYGLAVLLEKSKRNWFVGIRTPWTLSSDQVWEKTHSLGSRLLKVSSLMALMGVFFPKAAIFLVIVPMALSFIFLSAYSYFVFRQLNKKKR